MIRHGQAAFHDADNPLTGTGELQARRLGAFWARLRVLFDEVYVGPRSRHTGTAAIVGACYAEAGMPWPAPAEREEFDEHQVVRMLTLPNGRFMRRSDVRGLAEQVESAATPAERERAFWSLFEAGIKLWIDGVPEASEVETWPDFRRRVGRALDALCKGGGRGRRIAVITSIGPIVIALQRALSCADHTAEAMGWHIRNASVTQFLFSGDRFTLEMFNALPHLDDPQLWTYR
jgi:broad specificity phosphatase PhoE